MSVNKYTIRRDGIESYEITIPIQQNWDYEGLDMAIDELEDAAIAEVIGAGYDFEVDRFGHQPYNPDSDTSINYEFYFFSGGSLNTPNSWRMNYLGEGFTVQDIFYYSNGFEKSFFKLDFYDTVDDKKQKNYFTVIIPTQQGGRINALMNRTPVTIKYPKFVLDYVGDKEGFFLYWLKNPDFIPINTFYMTAKFWNAKTGTFTKMMNTPQSNVGSNKYNFDTIKYYYYRVVMDYINESYFVTDLNLNRIGTPTNPIRWYEYVNPPA